MTDPNEPETGYLAKPAPLPDPERAARDALNRHQCIPHADRELVEAAVDHGLVVRHGADNPVREATVHLMAGDRMYQAIVDYAAADAWRLVDSLRLEVERLRRINLGALTELKRINPHDDPRHVAVGLGNVRLLLGSSRHLTRVDPDLEGAIGGHPAGRHLDRALARISAEAPGHPAEEAK